MTEYGTLIKEIRIKHGETMGDMANWLNVKLPFVSAVENGKKKIPDDWLNKISVHYNLCDAERSNLEKAIKESQTNIKLDLRNADVIKRRMVIQFQRSFDNIDDDTAEKIYKILGGKE